MRLEFALRRPSMSENETFSVELQRVRQSASIHLATVVLQENTLLLSRCDLQHVRPNHHSGKLTVTAPMQGNGVAFKLLRAQLRRAAALARRFALQASMAAAASA